VVTIKAIFEAPDEDSRRDAIRAAIKGDTRDVAEVWEMAAEIVSKRIM
jgi:hypothetical protein